MQPLVSIIIPVYNTAMYLHQCIDSVVKQSYKNIELILIDDGSTDESGELCDSWAQYDGRIRVIHKSNGGVSAARNLGIDEAFGEYILFVDSDDWLDTDAIGTLVEQAESSKLDVVKYNYIREYEGKPLVKRNTFLEERIYTGDECLEICRQVLGLVGKELKHPENMNFMASSCTMLFRKKLLQENRIRFTDIWEIGSFEDGLFNFSALLHVRKFRYVDKAFYHYRKSSGTSETAGYRREYINKRLNLASIIKEKIIAEQKWEFFAEAYNNRMVHATMEISFNALRNKASWKERYKEIDSALNHPQFKEAYLSFCLDYLNLKWKIYFFFIKHSMTLPICILTAIILKIKSRGVR